MVMGTATRTTTTTGMNITELMSARDVAGTSLADPAMQAAYRDMWLEAGPTFYETNLKALCDHGIQPYFMLGHIHRHQLWEQDGPAGRQCIAYAGSIGRFHYGEQGDKGFLLWEVTPDGAACVLMPTPARRTMDVVFEGRPDLDALREAIEQHGIGGAHVRVRWTVADEDRHAVDRATITRLLADAAQVKLEGRIVPLVRARAPGISQLASLADKVREWARLVDVDAACVLACLESLQEGSPAEIAEGLLAKQRTEAQGFAQDDLFEEELGAVAELAA